VGATTLTGFVYLCSIVSGRATPVVNPAAITSALAKQARRS